jgi:hypothetical protein
MIHYTTIHKVLPNGPAMTRLIRPSSPASGIWRSITTSISRILHGNSSNTVAKKAGAGIGCSGHKHQKGGKVLAIVGNNGFVLTPLPVAPVNEADTASFRTG